MMRSSHWAHRARAEYRAASVSWHATITLSPIEHARIDARVAAIARKTGAGWLTDWSDRDWFRERCSVAQDLVSDWIRGFREAEVARRREEARRAVFRWPVFRKKRQDLKVRSAKFCVVRAKWKYLLVAEEHANELKGRPHFHMLIHEPWQFELVRAHEYYRTAKGELRVNDRSTLKERWKLGHMTVKLCADSKQASYLCKYLAKDMLWRVRASKNYGSERSEESEPAVAARPKVDISRSEPLVPPAF